MSPLQALPPPPDPSRRDTDELPVPSVPWYGERAVHTLALAVALLTIALLLARWL